MNKSKTLCSWQISDRSREEVVGIFYENEFQKKNQIDFDIEKVIYKKGNRLHVKWKYKTWIRSI